MQGIQYACVSIVGVWVLHYVTLCDKLEVANTAQCGVVQHELSIAVTVTWQPPMWHRHHQPQSGSAAVDTRQKLSTIVILSGYSVSSSYIVNFLFPFCLVTIWWDERRVMSFRNWLARITIIRKVTTLVSYCFVDHKIYWRSSWTECWLCLKLCSISYFFHVEWPDRNFVIAFRK